MLLLLLQEDPLRKSKQEYHKYLSIIVKCILIWSWYVIIMLLFVAKYTNETVICFYKNVSKLWPALYKQLWTQHTHVFHTQSGVGNNISLKICNISIRCYKYWRQCNTRPHRAYRTLLECFNGRVVSCLPANQMSGHSNKYSNHLNSGISNFTCLYV